MPRVKLATRTLTQRWQGIGSGTLRSEGAVDPDSVAHASAVDVPNVIGPYDLTVGPGQQYATLSEALAVVQDNELIGIFGGGTVYTDDPADLTGIGRALGFRFNLEIFDGTAFFTATNLATAPSLPAGARDKGWAVVGSTANPTVSVNFTGSGVIRDIRGAESGSGEYWDGIRGQELCTIYNEWETLRCDNGISGSWTSITTPSIFDDCGRDSFTHGLYCNNKDNPTTDCSNATFRNMGDSYGIASSCVQARGRDLIATDVTWEPGSEGRFINKINGGSCDILRATATMDWVTTQSFAAFRYQDDADPGSYPSDLFRTRDSNITCINGPGSSVALENTSSTLIGVETGNFFTGFNQNKTGNFNGADLGLIQNEWAIMSGGGNTIDALLAPFEPYPASGSDGSTALRRSWNGAYYNTLTKAIGTCCAGGHGNTGFNVTAEGDPVTADWAIVDGPTSSPPTSNDSHNQYGDGRQGSRHTYGTTTHIPTEGAKGLAWNCGGSVWRNGDTSSACWTVDLDTGAHVARANNPEGSFANGAACWCPSGGPTSIPGSKGRVVLTHNKGGFFINAYDVDSMAWVGSSVRLSNNINTYWHMEYDPGTGLILLAGGGNLMQINPTTLAIVSQSFTGDDGFRNDKAPAVTTHQDAGKMVAFAPEVGPDLYIIDMNTNVCSRQSMGGIDPTSSTYTDTTYNGTYGACRRLVGLADDSYVYFGRTSAVLLGAKL